MSSADKLALKVGLVALRQAAVDEWLVEVLIALLHPLDAASAQIIVGKSSLDLKGSLVRQLSKQIGIPLDTEVSSGKSLSTLLTDIKKLNETRDRVVHSYYEQSESDEKRMFRSRQSTVETMSIDQIEELAAGLASAVEGLRSFVEILSARNEVDQNIGTIWGEPIRGVHEAILAGHLAERNMLTPIAEAVAEGTPIYLRLRGIHREFVGPETLIDDGEFLAEIDPRNWSAVVTSSSGEQEFFGDTGWRNVTALAREDDPEIEFAGIRRVGGSVQVKIAGGNLPTSVQPAFRDRLEARAFGAAPESVPQAPAWVQNLDGFRPKAKN